MDKDLAHIIATAGLRASRELSDIMPLLVQQLPEDRELRLAIAAVIYEINVAVLRPAFDAAPDLEAEFEARLAKYGRAS